MTQADELESLCHALLSHTEIAQQNMNRTLSRLEAIANAGGFLDRRTVEHNRLRSSVSELIHITDRIHNVRAKLVTNARVRA